MHACGVCVQQLGVVELDVELWQTIIVGTANEHQFGLSKLMGCMSNGYGLQNWMLNCGFTGTVGCIHPNIVGYLDGQIVRLPDGL